MEIKTEIINYNKQYNIIKIYKSETIEFYLEKNGYSNLYYIVGVYEDTNLTKNYICKAIEIAELSKFWGED